MEFRKSVHIDVTEHKRTPAEESFYESYLLRKHSDVGNLYASNVYEGQCFQKTLKHITRERHVLANEIDREMKRVQKKMCDLRMKSKGNNISRNRQLSLGCISNMNAMGGCNEKALSFPVIAKCGKDPKNEGKCFSRAFSDNSKEELSVPNFFSSSARTASAKQMGKLNRTVAGEGRPLSAQVNLLPKNSGQRNSKKNTVPTVFVTEIAGPPSGNQSKEHCQAHSGYESDRQGKEYSQTLALSPADAKGRRRAAKSYEDLLIPDSTVFVERRPRSITISTCTHADPRESFEMRYVPREDRVKSAASVAALPKI